MTQLDKHEGTGNIMVVRAMKQMKYCGPSFLEIKFKKLACFVDISDEESKDDDEESKNEEDKEGLLVETDAKGNPIRKLQPSNSKRKALESDDSASEAGEEFLLLLPRIKNDGTTERTTKATKTLCYRMNLNVRSMYNSYIHAVSSTCPRKLHHLLPMKKVLTLMMKNNKSNINRTLAKNNQIHLLGTTRTSADNDSVDIIDDLIRAESSKNVVTAGGGVEIEASRAVVLRTNSNLVVEVDNKNVGSDGGGRHGAVHGEDTDTTTMTDSLPPSPPRLTSSPLPLMALEQPLSIKALVGPPPPPPPSNPPPTKAPPTEKPQNEMNNEDDDLFSFEEDAAVPNTKKEGRHVGENPSAKEISGGVATSEGMANKVVEIASLDLLREDKKNGKNTIHMTNSDGKQIVVAVRDDHEQIVSDGNPPTFAEFNMDVEVEVLQIKKLLFPSEDSATNEMTVSSGSSLSESPSLTASSLSNPSDENYENFSIPSTPSDENESTNSQGINYKRNIKKDWVVEAEENEDRQNRAWLKYLKSKKINLDHDETVTKKKRSTSAAIAKLIVPKKVRAYYKSMKWFAGEVVKEIYNDDPALDDLSSSSSSSSNDGLFGLSSDEDQQQPKKEEKLGKPIMITSSCSKKHVELLLNPDDENEDPTFKEGEGRSDVVQISDKPLVGLSDDSTFEDVYYDAEEDSDHEEDMNTVKSSQQQLLPPMSHCCTCPQDPCDTYASTSDIIENTLSFHNIIQEKVRAPAPPPVQGKTFIRGSKTYNTFKYPLDEIAEDTVVEVGIGEDEFVYDEELLMQLLLPKADVRSRSTTTVTRETVTT